MQLHEVRKQLRFSRDFLQLIEMLKNIAGQQYHLMEREKERFDEFMNAFAEFFRVIDLANIEDPLMRPASDVTAAVVLTSDSGFMGGLNGGVIRKALSEYDEVPREKVRFVVIGEKGAGVFTDMGREHKAFPGIEQATMYEQSLEVKDFLVREVLEQRVGRVRITYPKALSFTQQRIETVTLLPCADLFEMMPHAEAPASAPRLGRIAHVIADARGVIVESSYKDIVEHLAGVWVTSKLYEVFEDAKLAEFAARAVHLEGSEQKLREQYKKLRHEAFRASHELIDKGMREGFSAKMSRAKRRNSAERGEEGAPAASG